AGRIRTVAPGRTAPAGFRRHSAGPRVCRNRAANRRGAPIRNRLRGSIAIRGVLASFAAGLRTATAGRASHAARSDRGSADLFQPWSGLLQVNEGNAEG